MTEYTCGIDFGTSNSAIAVAGPEAEPFLIKLENGSCTQPSTVFYEEGSALPLFGEKAVAAYIDGREGRFMRSLKRVLGTEIMAAGTQINGKTRKFENILAQYINHLKKQAEEQIGKPLRRVVMGRPVHFRDNDPQGDIQAENELKKIAGSIGFSDVLFQFEPIAAAFAHEAVLEREALACVVDVGGGTSDFTIVRVGPRLAGKTDRKDDILASAGVRVGGNDFDKSLSLRCFMPEFGYKTTYGSQNLFVPSSQYFELSEWSKVNAVYNHKNLKTVSEVLAGAHRPELYARLKDILLRESGHRILNDVERTKIALTGCPQTETVLDYIADAPKIRASRQEFEESIAADAEKIASSLAQCLTEACVEKEEIGLVILTGGSTEIPLIFQTVRNFFPQAAFSSGNKFSSVGLGLAYDSRRRFADRG